MTKGLSVCNVKSMDAKLFGEESSAMGADSYYDVVDEVEARLVAGCLDLTLDYGHTDLVSVKQENVDEEELSSDFSQASRPSLDNLGHLPKTESFIMPFTEIKQESASCLTNTKRDPLDDEIDELLNWRPTRKILLWESDKKRQNNKSKFGIKGSELEFIIDLCKGCKKCNLSGLRLKNSNKKFTSSNSKFSNLLRKRNNNLSDTSKKLQRRSLRNQGSPNVKSTTFSIARPRTRSQLTNLKGKVDFLEQPSLDSSSIKVLRSRSFFLPRVTNQTDSKVKSKTRVNQESSQEAKPLDDTSTAKQPKPPTVRKRSRSQIWLTKRRRSKQRKQLTSVKSGGENSSKVDASKKARIKSTRWDDFIKRQREALQQFEGDGKSTKDMQIKNSSSSRRGIKTSHPNIVEESNLFDKLKVEQDYYRIPLTREKARISENHRKEVQAVFKGPITGKPVHSLSEDSKYSDSRLSSVSLCQAGSTILRQNVTRSQAKAAKLMDSIKKESTETRSSPSNVVSTKIVTSTVASSHVTTSPVTSSNVTSACAQAPNANKATTITSSTPTGDGKLPLYVPVNFQGRTYLCPFIPTSSDTRKYTIIQTSLPSSVGKATTTSVSKVSTTLPSSTTVSTPSSNLSSVGNSSQSPASSQSGIQQTGITPVSGQKNVIKITIPPQSLNASKLKKILPMPADLQSSYKFPQLVVLQPAGIVDKNSSGSPAKTLSSPILLRPKLTVSSSEARESKETACSPCSTAMLSSSKNQTDSNLITSPTISHQVALGTIVKPILHTKSSKDSIIIPLSPVKSGQAHVSPKATPQIGSQVIHNLITGSSTLKSVGIVNASATQLISGSNIRLGAPITISPAKTTELNTLDRKTLNLKVGKPTHFLFNTTAPSLKRETGVADTNGEAIQSSCGTVTELNTPPVTAASRGSVTDTMVTIAQLREKERELYRSRARLKKSIRRLRKKRRLDYSSSSESGTESTERDSVFEGDSDSDVKMTPTSPNIHCYNTRLRTRHNKLKIVRTNENTWKIAYSDYCTPMESHNTEVFADRSTERKKESTSSLDISKDTEDSPKSDILQSQVNQTPEISSLSITSRNSTAFSFVVTSPLTSQTKTTIQDAADVIKAGTISTPVSQTDNARPSLDKKTPKLSSPSPPKLSSSSPPKLPSSSPSKLSSSSPPKLSSSSPPKLSSSSPPKLSSSSPPKLPSSSPPKLSSTSPSKLSSSSPPKLSNSSNDTTVSPPQRPLQQQQQQQQGKVVTPPFNALLVKQPDGSFKLQFLQNCTETTSLSTPSVVSSMSPLNTPTSDMTNTNTDNTPSRLTPCDFLSTRIEESPQEFATLVYATPEPVPDDAVVVSEPFTKRELKIDQDLCDVQLLEENLSSPPDNVMSSATEMNRISAATDQLRKILVETSPTGVKPLKLQKEDGTVKLGDLSDHVYAKFKPRKNRKRLSTETISI